MPFLIKLHKLQLTVVKLKLLVRVNRYYISCSALSVILLKAYFVLQVDERKLY